MTPREQAAFAAGIETARQMAMVAAVSIETRDDAQEVRQQAAATALQGLAEGLSAFFDAKGTHQAHSPEADPIHCAIAAEPGGSGEIPCPACAGRLRWIRDSTNGHVHGECETQGCLRWMQ